MPELMNVHTKELIQRLKLLMASVEEYRIRKRNTYNYYYWGIKRRRDTNIILKFQQIKGDMFQELINTSANICKNEIQESGITSAITTKQIIEEVLNLSLNIIKVDELKAESGQKYFIYDNKATLTFLLR